MKIYSILVPVEIDLPQSFRFVTAHTIIHTSSELAIIDTGFPGADIKTALQMYSFNASDFTLVINTHLHLDHCGNNSLFSSARVLYSNKEYNYQKKWHEAFMESSNKIAFIQQKYPHLTQNEIRRMVPFLVFSHTHYYKDFTEGGQNGVIFFEDSPALPDWLTIHQTPGHTPFHLSFTIEVNGKVVVIPGDLIPGRKTFFSKKDYFIEFHENPEENERQISRLRSYLQSFSHIVIHPSHDRPFNALTGAYLPNRGYSIGPNEL